MTTITTPGDALRVAMALLRHNGYSVHAASADWVPGDDKTITVRGRITDLDDDTSRGTFLGTATVDGRVTLTGGSFGRITYAGDRPVEVDPFHDL